MPFQEEGDNMVGSSTDNNFTFGIVVLAVAIIFLMPTMVNLFVERDIPDDGPPENFENVMDGYRRFTGSYATNENVWSLTGIYTPVGIDADGDASTNYAYTPDHWIYGARVGTYTPSQFSGSSAYSTTYDNGFYYYNSNTNDGNKAGDLYTSVAMDVNQKSDIFFTPSGKRVNGENWYYEYTGYRYSFQPLADYIYKNTDGDLIRTVASSTSLSLIWYDYYGNSGISGQLVLSGSDSGVAYLTSSEIVSAFNSANNMAKFNMTFNGNDMNVYIKIKNEYTSAGYSVAECFDLGYWEIMITSISTNIQTYISTDYSMNIYNIWDTFVDLFTFNMDDYNLSPEMQLVASVTISVVLYAALISIGLTCYPILILAGAVALLQTIATMDFEIPDLWPFW